MRLVRTILGLVLLLSAPVTATAQSLIGEWQFNLVCNDVPATRFLDFSLSSSPPLYEYPVDQPCGSSNSDGVSRAVNDCFTGALFVHGPVLLYPNTSTDYITAPAGFEFNYMDEFSLPFVGPCGGTLVGSANSEQVAYFDVTQVNGPDATRMEGTWELRGVFWRNLLGATCGSERHDPWILCDLHALRTETPTGTPVTVEPLDDGTLTFDNVTAPGSTRIISSGDSTISLAPNFRLLDPPIFYDVTTTVSFTGNIEVCLPYPDADNDGCVDGSTLGSCTNGEVDETTLQLHHAPGGIPPFGATTQVIDTVNNKVCATVTSLSPFAFMVEGALPGAAPALSGPVLAALIGLLAGGGFWMARRRSD